MADMCYECQFSDNGYFCRFMEHGVCTAVSCKWMVKIEERIALDIYKLHNGYTKSIKTKGGTNHEREEAVEHLSLLRY